MHMALAEADRWGAVHYYTCRNGHLFTVSACGTLVGSGRCPDCGSLVGPRTGCRRQKLRAWWQAGGQAP